MAEAIDIFAEAFRVYIGALGCALHLSLSDPAAHESTPAGQLFPSKRMATVRTAPEMMKALTFILRQQVLRYERTNKIRIELPPDMMTRALEGADLASWNRCWEYS